MQICLGSSCFSRGNKEVVIFIRDYLKKNHLDDRIVFRGARCMGLCSNGPNMRINDRIIENVAFQILNQYLKKNLATLSKINPVKSMSERKPVFYINEENAEIPIHAYGFAL